MITLEEVRTVQTDQGADLKVRYEWVLWLRRQIEKSGKTYRQLAAETGVSHNMLSKLQKLDYLQINQPSTETCHKLARTFEEDPDLVLYLAKHRDVDPRKSLKVKPEIARLQRRILDLSKIQDEEELQTAIKAANSFLDLLLNQAKR